MKLVFKKDENSQISVFQDIDGKQSSFSYVEMIKCLIASKQLDNPQVDDGFSEAEKKSIESMVGLINKEVGALSDQEATGESSENEADGS